jgi:cytochrome c oxidase assembly protein subunit 15
MSNPDETARNDRRIAIWLLLVCTLIYAMVVLGGVTRLTRSGLSIVEWDPIMGVIPPITEQEWHETFDKYKESPEYKKVNVGMDLQGFKSIFYFEYFHRLLGRLIGLAFLLPFLYFLIRGRIRKSLVPQMVTMFVLGGLQGLLGWYMVKSGLVDRPHVSQYRLTAHLTAAIIIYSYILWTALSLLRRQPENTGIEGFASLRSYGLGVTGVILVMIISGGFVAGTKAGFAYNTFPLMGDRFIPDGLLMLQPWYMNLFENITTVQFDHRMIAYLLMLLVPLYWWRVHRSQVVSRTRTMAHLMLAMFVIQVTLGISTLLLHVPVALGASHQGGALLLLTTALLMNHELRKR